MKDTIENLKKELEFLKSQCKAFDRTGLDHGSLDQTRSMLFESMFKDAINKLEGTISQLEILNRELY